LESEELVCELHVLCGLASHVAVDHAVDRTNPPEKVDVMVETFLCMLNYIDHFADGAPFFAAAVAVVAVVDVVVVVVAAAFAVDVVAAAVVDVAVVAYFVALAVIFAFLVGF